jgi:hypothetical protein
LMNAAGGRPGRAPEVYYQNYDTLVWDLKALRAGVIADMESHGGVGTLAGGTSIDNLSVAQVDAQMHDVEGATLRLKTTPVDEKDQLALASAATDRALLAEEAGDLKSAAREWDIMAVAYANPSVSTTNPNVICFAALTYEKTGQPARADAALDAVKLPFVDCYRFRGDLKDLRGDWAGAQEWYAKAVHGTQHARGVLLLGCGACQARRSRRCGGEARSRPPERPALGRPAQGLGRCVGQTGSRQGSAGEV